MNISIQPVPCYPAPAVSLKVDDGQVNLGVGANFQWALLDANGNIVAGPERMALTDAQYTAWTGDDAYVANCIAANLPGSIVPVDAPSV